LAYVCKGFIIINFDYFLEWYHWEEHVEAKISYDGIQSIYWNQNFQTLQHTHDIDMQRKIKYNCNDNITTAIMSWQIEMKFSREIEIDMLSHCWAKCLVNCKKCTCYRIDWPLFPPCRNCSQFFSLSPILIALNNRPKRKKKRKKACKLKKETKTLTNEKTKDINTNNFVKTIFCGKEKIRKQIYL
jgi:hypothetical protein